MKINLVLSFILVLVFLVSYGCAPQTLEGSNLPPKIAQPEKLATASSFLTYENDDYGVKIQYPADWEQTETEDLIVAFASPKTGASDALQENLGLTMNDLAGQGLALPKYNEIAIEQLKQTFPDIAFIESGSTVLSNNPAYKVVFTASSLKVMQVWTVKNDLAYVWSFVSTEGSYADYLSTIQKMLDSFEITRNIRAQTEDKQVGEQEAGTIASASGADPAFIGSWSVFSERIFYDIGGAGSAAVPVTRSLELLKDGTWEFGDSEGTWTVTEITNDDWSRWGISSYGPARKMTMNGWNKGVADGPVEESSGRIDFIWVIYHVEPPLVQNAGTVWLKFGH